MDVTLEITTGGDNAPAVDITTRELSPAHVQAAAERIANEIADAPGGIYTIRLLVGDEVRAERRTNRRRDIELAKQLCAPKAAVTTGG